MVRVGPFSYVVIIRVIIGPAGPIMYPDQISHYRTSFPQARGQQQAINLVIVVGNLEGNLIKILNFRFQRIPYS